MTPAISMAKPHMIAEVGKLSCLRKAKSPKLLLKSYKITLKGASRSERKVVANTAESIAQLTNDAQVRKIMSGLSVYFKKTLGNSSHGGCLPAHQLIPGEIHMGRTCKSGYKIPNVEGIFVHELGHFVANKHGMYPKYRSSVKKRCKISTYMYQNSAGKKHRSINEEFAEVFASYLIYPKKLKKKCPQSYKFLRDKLFLGSEATCL